MRSSCLLLKTIFLAIGNHFLLTFLPFEHFILYVLWKGIFKRILHSCYGSIVLSSENQFLPFFRHSCWQNKLFFSLNTKFLRKLLLLLIETSALLQERFSTLFKALLEKVENAAASRGDHILKKNLIPATVKRLSD